MRVRPECAPTVGWRRWWRFNGVGLAGIGVQFAVLGVLADRLGVDYRLATAVAVASAVVHNFAWHRGWTWADRVAGRSSLVLLGRFALANGVTSLAGNLAIMWLLVGRAGMPVVPANAIAITLCGLANYWAADRLVFGARNSERPAGTRCRIRHGT